MYQKIKSGFTIVELSLAIAFIALLSITVALMINNSISAYHRGITLNQLNTTGMDVVEDMQKAIQASPARVATNECADLYGTSEKDGGGNLLLEECKGNSGQSFVVMTRSANVKRGSDSDTMKGVPVSGVFCTGKYSYIWNSGYFFNDENGSSVSTEKLSLRYKTMNDTSTVVETKQDFKLLKLEDESRAVCKAAAGGMDSKYKTEIDNTTIDISCSKNSNNNGTEICNVVEEEPTDVLEGSSNLALYGLTVGVPAMSGSTKNMLYSVSFVLGTVQGGINVQTSGNYCATPEGAETDVENFDYCAINKFNFVAQTTGG